MDPIPILALEETSKVGPKTIEKVLSIFPSKTKRKKHHKNSIQMTLNLGKKNNESPHF